MEKTTKQKGNITELECLLAFEKRGIEVSVPWGENTRYDMIIDIDNKLYKIQCKTSRETKNGSFSFATSSTRLNTRGSFKACYSKEEIDFFATSFNDNIYLIPVENCGSSGAGKTIRYILPRNQAYSTINWHEDYLLDNMIMNNMKPLCSFPKEQNLCKDCGKPTKDKKAIRCWECSKKQKKYDKDRIVNRYKEIKNIKKVAEEFNCCEDTVSSYCKEDGVEILSSSEINKEILGKKIKNIDKDIIFDSIRDGARWVIDNKYTKNTSIGSCAKYIKDACNGIQEYSYGFRWEYV